MQTLCQIDKLLSSFEDELEQGRIQKAAQSVSEAHTLMESLAPGTDAGCDAKIFSAVREDLFRKLAHVKEKLDDMWRKAVVWHYGAKAGLQIASQVEAPDGRRDVALDEILGGMAVFGTLETRLQEFGKQALQVIFEQMCSENVVAPEISTNSKHTTMTLVAVAAARKAGKGKKKKAAADAVLCNDLYQRINKALSFFAENLGGGDNTAVLGACLWPALSTAVQKCISDHIPSKHNRTTARFDSVFEQTAAFEAGVVALGLVEATTVLTDYVEATGVARASSSRREEILEQAREILAPCSGDTYNMINTVEVQHETERGGLFQEDEDEESAAAAESGGLDLSQSIYRLPKCKISVPTQSLVDFAYRSLSEMSESDPDGAIVTFYGVRDTFDLFRAIVPTRNKASLAQYPQLCAIFHNDCFYIAHHLLTLGHQFRNMLPDSFVAAATFVDMVPVFQELGEKYFVEMLRSQRAQLRESVEGANGLGQTDDDARFAVVNAAITFALNRLDSGSKVWKGVLPDSIFERAMGGLLDSVMAAMVAEVLKLEDISAIEGDQLHHLLSRVTERAPGLFGMDASTLKEHCPNWGRFVQVMAVLEARLTEIEQMWLGKQIVLKIEELRHMIKALFSNNPNRARVLALLK